MRTARVAAQAKVNLALFVGRPDATGYHEIRTLFQRIDLADDIVIRVGGATRSLDCAGPHLPAAGLGDPTANLAYRAAAAYAERASWVTGFAIELTKHIPVGGGLGGGSADAGATLRALEALAPTPLGAAVVRDIAARLGADVAFLASDAVTAVGTGRGDLLRAVPPLAPRQLLLLVPPFGIPTAHAYRWLDEDDAGTLATAPELDLTAHDAAERWTMLTAVSHNDFERVVERRHPMLADLRRRLSDAGAAVARLSGSGSTVFGVFAAAPPAPQALPADTLVIPSRTSARVVQVEVRE